MRSPGLPGVRSASSAYGRLNGRRGHGVGRLVKKLNLAAVCTMELKQTAVISAYAMSTTTRYPFAAAPTAIPTAALSLIGVSLTRSVPKLLREAVVDPTCQGVLGFGPNMSVRLSAARPRGGLGGLHPYRLTSYPSLLTRGPDFG